jgi:ADP-heptose:LPS heptosyltransferase
VNEQVGKKNKDKILLIRMLALGDTLCIGVPAVRFYKHKYPDAELHFLTFAQGAEIMELAEPDVIISSLSEQQWPNDFLAAMEAFLGLAEEIIGQGFSQIVTLDTSFMPCFLARFLKDAGEPISGNLLNRSVQQLLEQFQDQSLQATYVNNPAEYMDSTYFSMARWHTRWWEGSFLPDNGYPEYYLRCCFGFNDLEMNMSVTVQADAKLTKQRETKKVVALCLAQSDDGYCYPHIINLQNMLEKLGYAVWSDSDKHYSVKQKLGKLAASDLMVTKSGANQWFATASNCPTLLITANSEPRALMPDYATDQTAVCPIHGSEQGMKISNKCLCDDPLELAESIDSIFNEAVSGQAGGDE